MDQQHKQMNQTITDGEDCRVLDSLEMKSNLSTDEDCDDACFFINSVCLNCDNNAASPCYWDVQASQASIEKLINVWVFSFMW